MASIVWFNQDRRLEDNPALAAAIDRKTAVIPLYIWDPQSEGEWLPGSNCQWWIHHSLENLKQNLAEIGLPLVVRKGNALDCIHQIIKETKSDAVFWNRRYEPWAIASMAQIKSELHAIGVACNSFNGSLLFEPWKVANKQHKPFQVFTSYWKQCLALDEPSKPILRPRKAKPYPGTLDSLEIQQLQLQQIADLQTWTPGEDSAASLLNRFLEEAISEYIQNRDFPSIEGVSKLSPYLHHGEISPRTIWHAAKMMGDQKASPFLRQLGWREFAYHLLYHFPQTPTKPLRSKFSSFPWKSDESLLKAWQQGMTGYPFVDAGMRELLHTGWMHNRVRMVVGSFLVKHLMLPWQLGAKWFWEKLVDADMANNTLGWQWVAGCGADAAPYFRIFNPITQGEKFDPDGLYIRKWIPELKDLPLKWLHQPWLAPQPTKYPKPIVDHESARQQALAAFKTLHE